MEYNHTVLKHKLKTEPEDKYAVQFQYYDLYQRLLIVKRQQERNLNERSLKSFDKGTRKSPPSRQTVKNKPGIALRSYSGSKVQNRRISSDFKQVIKIYSPSSKKKILTPEKFVGLVRFPTIMQKQRLGKKMRKVNRLKPET